SRPRTHAREHPRRARAPAPELAAPGLGGGHPGGARPRGAGLDREDARAEPGTGGGGGREGGDRCTARSRRDALTTPRWMAQATVSEFERRDDHMLSVLRRYVEALGRFIRPVPARVSRASPCVPGAVGDGLAEGHLGHDLAEPAL